MINEVIEKILYSQRNINNTHNKTIGSLLKHKRLKKRLTLEDVSKDICSISYLCKVENNQLILSEKHVPKLFERLGIDEADLSYNICNKWIETIISQQHVSPELFSQRNLKKDYQSKIITLAYYTHNKIDLEKSHNYLMDLLTYLEFFSVEEVTFYLYLNLKNEYNNQRYLEVIDLYSQIKKTPAKGLVLIYSKILVTKSLYKINLISEATSLLEQLTSSLIDLNLFDELIKLKNYEYVASAKKSTTEDLKKLVNVLSSNENYKLDYIWFTHYYYYVMDFKKALNYITKIAKQNTHYYTMYLITLDKLNKKEKLLNSINNSSFNKLPVSYQIVENYLKVKYEGQYDLSKLNKNLLANEKIIQEVIIRNYLNSEVAKNLKDRHHYKDLVKLLENKNKFLKRCLNLSI